MLRGTSLIIKQQGIFDLNSQYRFITSLEKNRVSCIGIGKGTELLYFCEWCLN